VEQKKNQGKLKTERRKPRIKSGERKATKKSKFGG
jgi:hypothetical protein